LRSEIDNLISNVNKEKAIELCDGLGIELSDEDKTKLSMRRLLLKYADDLEIICEQLLKLNQQQSDDEKKLSETTTATTND